MRFTLIDRIVELEPGTRIKAVKAVSMAEEYLADHFPRFPVLPGVMMLEAMTQAGAWLVRASEDFAHSLVVLGEARNVKYAGFVEPGRILTVTAEWVRDEPRFVHLKAQGTLDGVVAVTARLVLERFNLADQSPGAEAADAFARRNLHAMFALLYRPDDHKVPASEPATVTAD